MILFMIGKMNMMMIINVMTYLGTRAVDATLNFDIIITRTTNSKRPCFEKNFPGW